MLNEDVSIAALSRETGIKENTLYRWRAAVKANGGAVSPKKSSKHSASQKFAIVVETATMNEAELSEYCRQQGLYPEEIKAWRAQAEKAMADGMVSAKELREALALEKKRAHQLERDLARKEKALAETAALLTLRKKAAAIGGEGEAE